MEKRSKLEIVVTIISIIMVSVVAGVLIYQIITRESSPPDLIVTLGIPEVASQNYRVPVVVQNQGNTTAKMVKVKISKDDDSEESVLLEFDYIPADSEVSGWVSFDEKPNQNELKAMVIGYGSS
ncbi:MAG: hypothetical protein GX163_13180 [Bacteroidetes bacterium]|jgi:uncharacterized protein (TIGR02588 family)|nr:hypothetical protein [Bacteroidota bacterium]